MPKSGEVFMTEEASTKDSLLLSEKELNVIISDAFNGGVTEGRNQVQADIDATEKVNAELRLELNNSTSIKTTFAIIDGYRGIIDTMASDIKKLESDVDNAIARTNNVIAIGDNVIDLITGYCGTVTAVCEYQDGAFSTLIEGEVNGDNEPTEKWISTNRLQIEEK